MIKQLKIKNFQSHKDSTFDFDAGLNIIAGQSDSGKSAVIRALNWVITNKPGGDSFCSNFKKKKEKTEVTITLDSGDTVKRIKGGTTNSYFLNDTEFKAMGQSVPDEISDIFNINELNNQSQHDSPFLLSESAGEVTRKLNKIVNLEVMDKVLSECNSQRLKVNREVESLNEDIGNKTELLSEFDFIDSYESVVNVIEIKFNNLRDKTDKFYRINKCVTEYRSIKSEIAKLNIPEQDLIDKIDERFGKLATLSYDYEKIANLTSKVVNVNSVIKNIKIPNISKLENSFESYKDTLEDLSNLDQVINSIQIISKNIEKEKQKIQTLEKSLPEICPLCGNKL